MEATEKPKILIVDDRLENLLSLEILFENEPYDLIKASSGNEALAQVITHDFALVLLDVQMPEMDGFETAELMRNNKKTEHIPIIFITAISKEKRHIFKGYESGAVDYLFKPLDSDILKGKVRILIDLYRQKKIIENKNIQLNAANKKVIEQQKALVEEERIKVLLQMAGATAHELNQPLMVLLGNIELLQTNDNPEKLSTRLLAIEEAGKRISSIIKRIQFVRHDQKKTYPGGEEIIDFDQIQNIFWVEDEDTCFTVFKKMLSLKRTSRVTRATTIKEAKAFLPENKYDFAIFDLKLPDGNSLELINFMNKQGIKVPVLVLTGYGDDATAARCIQAGAHGYLPKGNISMEILHKGINRAFEKFHLDREMEMAVKKMAEMATIDELTGLYNRRYMQEVFDREFKRARRYNSDLSCMILDLDYFKQVNDTYGHACGDFVLKRFAKILEQRSRDSDYAFRYGGEEFLLLLTQTDLNGARVAAEKIRKYCESEEYCFEDLTLQVTVSIGIASVNSCLPEQAQDMTAFADKALYRAKADGRNCARIYKKEKEEAPHAEKDVYGMKGVGYLKEQLSVILEKTKTASMASIKLLIKDTGGDQIEEQNRIVVQYLTLICNKLHLPASVTNAIIQAATLHGCFKILLGEEIMQKKGPLTSKEKAKIESHPYMMIELANQFDFFSKEKSVLVSHHENYDGTGYPEGLETDEIPLGAKIFAIAEALAAMTSERPYREKIPPEKVISELTDNAGTQFDPMLVNLVLDLIAKNNLLDVPEEVITKAKEQLTVRH